MLFKQSKWILPIYRSGLVTDKIKIIVFLTDLIARFFSNDWGFLVQLANASCYDSYS